MTRMYGSAAILRALEVHPAAELEQALVELVRDAARPESKSIGVRS